MMKAEFMSLWDGLASSSQTRILILGATNRPDDIDRAILRRMPRRFAIGLPSAAQRRDILEILLQGVKLDRSDVLERLTLRTEGYSGSDLKEACRNAVMVPVRESIRRLVASDERKRDEVMETTGEMVSSTLEDLASKVFARVFMTSVCSASLFGECVWTISSPMGTQTLFRILTRRKEGSFNLPGKG